MKGLIFNLLSELAADAGCQDEAWEVALVSADEPIEDALCDSTELYGEQNGTYEFPCWFGAAFNAAPVWGWSPPETDSTAVSDPGLPRDAASLVSFRIQLPPDHPHFSLMMAWMLKP